MINLGFFLRFFVNRAPEVQTTNHARPLIPGAGARSHRPPRCQRDKVRYCYRCWRRLCRIFRRAAGQWSARMR